MRISRRLSGLLFALAFCAAALLDSNSVLGQAPTTQPAPAPTPPPAPIPAVPTSQPTSAPAIEEEGFSTSPTGLKHKDLKVGDGAQPQKGDKLKVRHKGTLQDGTEFDSSMDGKEPIEFRVGLQPAKVIPGWEETLLTMKVGGHRVLIVPPHLGYGLRGSPPKIPANATLRFEIELVAAESGPRQTETKKEDEVVTPSGLRYVELKAGDGEPVVEGSAMKLRAATWSSEGVLMGTTTDQADPMTIQLSQPNIARFKEGLLGMKAGGKRKMYVSQRPPSTQPTSAPASDFTITEVELVEVVSPPKMTDVPDDKLVATPSGLKYYDLKVGEGDSPKETSTIKVHYTGWFPDGTPFDSSVMRGQPTEMPLNQFVKGWIEGVGAMKVGGKRKLVIPPDLGYGEAGRRPTIPPNSTLIFEVELLEITRP